jgi:anaerobic selenocysteine-containing dehydrogenase
VEKSPSWAEGICGVDAAAIVGLARRWTSTKPVMLIPGYSIQRTDAGEEAARLCVALQLATKNFGLAGGSSGSLNNRLPGPRVGKIGEGGGFPTKKVPIVRWADAILEGEPAYPVHISAIYSAGGNFLNQGADIGKNIKAFQTLDFTVCHELFMTPTAQYCDVVLPAASPLQKEDVGVPWAGNYLLYKPRILPYEGQERSDYDIFSELASRFGAERQFTEGRSEKEWIGHFLASSEIDDVEGFKARGVYFGAEQERTGLAAFAADPEGKPLRTASGKVELAGPRWAGWGGRPHQARGVRLAGGTDCGDHPDEIIGNSLAMNAADTRGLGLKEGDFVEISSETGSTMATVFPTENIMRGVVSLYEGTWFSAPGAEGFMPGSANFLTSTRGTDESTSCIMHGIRVNVRKLEASTP